MAHRAALVFAALAVISRAAPQFQSGTASASRPDATVSGNVPAGGVAAGGSVSTSDGIGSASGATSNPGSSSNGWGSQPITIVLPPFTSMLPSISSSGTSSGSSGSPIAAVISLIPSAINRERDRFGNAVEQLVSANVNAITDSITSAAETGGKFASSGVRVIGSWPVFFGNLLG